nr:nicotinamide/nicotinic acid mononucleotide adenylyltransferase 2 [Quercus suber]
MTSLSSPRMGRQGPGSLLLARQHGSLETSVQRAVRSPLTTDCPSTVHYLVFTLLSRTLRQCRPSPSPSSAFKPAASAVAWVSSRRARHSSQSIASSSDPVILRRLYPFTQFLTTPRISVMADNDMTLDTYEFPASRLRRRITSADRTPLVLIACGSFSPITFLHLRMFEMAADYARFNTNFEVVGAYLSCVGDAYKKTGLVKAEHRVNMCNVAVQQSSWISVDPWEALHAEYLETAKVLDHFHREINEVMGGVETPVGKKQARIALLAGADLIQTMSTPGLWSQEDIDYILKNFGAFIVERTGTDVDEALSTLQQWRDNIWVIQQLVQNDISSTKIRLFRRRDMSIRYLVPEPVVQYIEEQNLYDEDGASSVGGEKGKGREEQRPGGSGAVAGTMADGDGIWAEDLQHAIWLRGWRAGHEDEEMRTPDGLNLQHKAQRADRRTLGV